MRVLLVSRSECDPVVEFLVRLLLNLVGTQIRRCDRHSLVALAVPFWAMAANATRFVRGLPGVLGLYRVHSYEPQPEDADHLSHISLRAYAIRYVQLQITSGAMISEKLFCLEVTDLQRLRLRVVHTLMS